MNFSLMLYTLSDFLNYLLSGHSVYFLVWTWISVEYERNVIIHDVDNFYEVDILFCEKNDFTEWTRAYIHDVM